jgi:hypothetical protein
MNLPASAWQRTVAASGGNGSLAVSPPCRSAVSPLCRKPPVAVSRPPPSPPGRRPDGTHRDVAAHSAQPVCGGMAMCSVRREPVRAALRPLRRLRPPHAPRAVWPQAGRRRSAAARTAHIATSPYTVPNLCTAARRFVRSQLSRDMCAVRRHGDVRRRTGPAMGPNPRPAQRSASPTAAGRGRLNVRRAAAGSTRARPAIAPRPNPRPAKPAAGQTRGRPDPRPARPAAGPARGRRTGRRAAVSSRRR